MKTHASNRLIFWMLAIASVLCVVTAVRIEYLDHLAGGAIQRKAGQEPDSKWRIGHGFGAYPQAEAQWRREKGLSPDAELSSNDREAIWARMQKTKSSPSSRDRLGLLLRSWGLIQYPLAAALLFVSLAAANRTIHAGISKRAFHFQAWIGALALGWAIYRGYFTSLGW